MKRLIVFLVVGLLITLFSSAHNITWDDVLDKVDEISNAIPGASMWDPQFAPGSSSNAQDNYLSYVTTVGPVRWGANRMPLKVYIKSGAEVPGYKPHYKQILADAWKTWSGESQGRIRYRLVNSADGADVVCGWTNKTTKRDGVWEAGNTGLKLILNRWSGRGEIIDADVKILTKFDGPLSDRELRRVCLHEVGHALGLQGHSPRREDVMFPVATFIQRPRLSSRDVKTVRLLYAGYPSHPSSREDKAVAASAKRKNAL